MYCTVPSSVILSRRFSRRQRPLEDVDPSNKGLENDLKVIGSE
jgi:hypothetical protein